ncbi:MAG: TMEM175 family protein [Thermoleophilaceae bacterium]
MRSEESSDFGRIVNLTDGVFAIALTLLVFGFEIPRSDHDLTRRVLELWPDLLAYLLSFAVVGRFWIVHHRFFGTLHRFDRSLLTLNFVYLSLVALVPFTTQLLGDHGDHSVAAIAYATVLGGAALVSWLMIRHTLVRDHVRAEARPGTEPFAARQALLAPGVLLASIPVALLSPYAAEAMWGLMLLTWPGQRRLGVQV